MRLQPSIGGAKAMLTIHQSRTEHHPFKTNLPIRYDRVHPIAVEPFGTPLQRDAQERIHHGRESIREAHGVCSFGRSVAVFLPEYTGRRFGGLVRDFRRVLLLGRKDRLSRLTHSTRIAGASVTATMPIIAADQRDFLPRAVAQLDNTKTLTGTGYRVLRNDASADEIRSIQELHSAVGLTPLPGALLRGHHSPVATIIQYDECARLIASATIVGLSDVGPGYADTAILVGVSVAPQIQGQGLGSGLTAASLMAARDVLGASRVIAVVHPANEVALRTNARFGMLPVAGLGAQYVEHGGSA
jgi:GNAT superfamily N-acetyltransferase